MVTAGGADGGIAHGELLMRFADAVVAVDQAALAGLRAEIEDAMGAEALVDAAAVAAIFDALDRVADATGITLEDWKARSTADFRADIGIDAFAAAAEKGGE